MLVFENGAVLSEHYFIIHRESKQIQVGFGISSYSDDEEESKAHTRVARDRGIVYKQQEDYDYGEEN